MGPSSDLQPYGRATWAWGSARLFCQRGQLGAAVTRAMVNWVNYIPVARNTVNYVNSSIWGNYIFINWS